jgi:small subunit ribosomal protein S13
MAEEKQKKAEKTEKPEERTEALVRILGYDVRGEKNIYAGLTKIKGVSWTISNAVCLKLGYPKSKKIFELTKADIAKIEEFLKKLPLKDFLKNRRLDRETGESSHLYGTDLDLKKQFDIKRLKQIKSYRGVRHSSGLPVRGQRTRANFRKKGKAVGVSKKAHKK